MSDFLQIPVYQVDLNSTITSLSVNVNDGNGNIIDSTLVGLERGLDVYVLNSSLPLPAGAATSALQITGNASLASIDSKLTAPLSVTGPLTDAQLRATPVPVSGTTSISGNVTVVQPTGTNLHTVVDSGSISVSNFPATQPISGTVTANQGTSAIPSNAWYMRITDGVSAVGITSFSLNTNITNTSLAITAASLPLPTGAATSALQTTGNTSLSTIATALTLAQGSTTSGQTGALTLAAVTTAAPSYTTGQTSPLSLTTAGALRVDASGSTQPISGTVTANAGTGTFTVGQATGSNLHTVIDSGTLTGITNTISVSMISGSLSQISGASLTLGQKTMANSIPMVIASDQSTLSVSAGSPTTATYSAAATITTVASATDVFTLTGSGTKTIRVTRITVSGTNTGNTNALVNIVKRSTANTLGTSTTPAAVPNDSTNAAATAVARAYTANPTLGTTVGTVDTTYLFLPLLASSGGAQTRPYEYGNGLGQPITLRGTGEVIAVNLNGVALGGTTTITAKIEWTET